MSILLKDQQAVACCMAIQLLVIKRYTCAQEIAKKRQRTGFLSVFNDSQIQSFQSESHGDGDMHSHPARIQNCC